MSRIDHHRPQYADLFGHFRRSYHLEMVSDNTRTNAIFRALRRALRPDTVFCELGCGSAIFSTYAASRCSKVYTVERDPVIAETAALNIEQCKYSERIELIHDDALAVELPEKVDVILCEMMSIWAIEEPEVPVFNRAHKDLLREGGIFLPVRIVNLAELGYYDFRFGDIVMKAAIPLFTGIPRPAVMTERKTCKVLDFSGHISPDLHVDVEMDAIASGLVNSVCLSSVVQMGPDTVFAGSDSLMPQTVVPLEEEINVSVGDHLRFRASTRARIDLEESSFRVDII